MSKVSIITPSYNRAYIIHETAESIFNQTYDNWEWIIVDDGSTDNSWDVLKSFAEEDNRVKIYKRDREPKGACTCRNIAVEKCTGDYVMFLDTDDVLAPYCLEQRVQAMSKEPECDFVIFPMMLFRKQPDDLGLLWNIDKPEDDLNRFLKGDAVCQGTGPLWKKESFMQVGMWNEDLRIWQDVELHVRSLLYPARFKKRLDLKPDVYLRISDDSLSRVGYYSPQKLNSRVTVFKYVFKELVDKGVFGKYKDGLRVMSGDIIIGLIKTGCYDDAMELVAMIYGNGIIGQTDVNRIKRYLWTYKLKLYYISRMYKKIEKSVKDIFVAEDVTIGKYKFTNNTTILTSV